MRLIPPYVYNLIAKRSMLGASKPTYQVTITGQPGDAREYLNSGVKVIQGYNEGTNSRISNFVPTTDGRFMCAWTFSSKEIGIGYCPDERFFYQDYPCTSVLNTDISVDTIGCQQISLFRRTDGKVLMFVVDPIAKGGSCKCYISDSGNGDDFALLSTILTVSTGVAGATLAHANVPLEIDVSGTKRIVLTFGLSNNYDPGYIFKTAYIYTSDDQGATWTQRKEFYPYSIWMDHATTIAQPAQLPSGHIVTSVGDDSANDNVYYSTNNGVSWSNLDDWSYQFSEQNLSPGGGPGERNLLSSGFYYCQATHTAYRVVIGSRTDENLKLVSRVYYLKNPTWERFTDKSLWKVGLYINSSVLYHSPKIIEMPSGNLAVSWCDDQVGTITDYGVKTVLIGFTPPVPTPLDVKSIDIYRNRGMAVHAKIALDNKGGKYSPDKVGGDWEGVIWPNKQIVVEQGYGEDLTNTFTGLIDKARPSSYPQELKIEARGAEKVLYDQLVCIGGEYVVEYTDEPIEDIFTALCAAGGMAVAEAAPTGMTLTKTFRWESYRDAISYLEDIADFKFWADEDGAGHFVPKFPAASPSVDYTFTEGVDLIFTGMDVADEELYSKIIVHGEDADGEVIEAVAEFTEAATYGVLSGKVMKVNARDADTLEKCQAIAEAIEYGMRGKGRRVHFLAVAVPWLQAGDCVKVVESSAPITQKYILTDISLHQDARGFTMEAEAYCIDHAP